ncbi:hypothetical protein JOC95_002975 [Bacillus tianshenii]|uniref:Group-specific protein n=1 Tax=Sutcliffiella tianshenii TaxID=1463404 RepID=A0ABS2P2C0_9BACI|nr:hypothetical protein [Bacillus tianshenii]
MKTLLFITFVQLLTFPLFLINFYTLFPLQTVKLIWTSLILIGLFFGFKGVITHKEEIKMFMLSTLTVITSFSLLLFMYLVSLSSM